MSEQCANNSVRKWQTEGSEFYVISDSTCYSYHATVSTDYVEFNTNRHHPWFIQLELKSSDSEIQ